MPGSDSIDETIDFRPKFNADGMLVVVTKDSNTGDILMVAYMNNDALVKSLETGDAWYWSRSRQKLWRKGETSGHTQKIRDIRIDCDQDAIELIVDQTGPACHTNRRSCFYRKVVLQDGVVSLSHIPD